MTDPKGPSQGKAALRAKPGDDEPLTPGPESEAALASTSSGVAAETESGSPTEESQTKRKKKKSPTTHPPTLSMVVEAIEQLPDKQGTSVQAIRTWILENYKTVRPDMIKVMLKKGLSLGLDKKVLVRPKKQFYTQILSGRYRVAGGALPTVAPSTSQKPKAKAVARRAKKKETAGGKPAAKRRKPAPKRVAQAEATKPAKGKAKPKPKAREEKAVVAVPPPKQSKGALAAKSKKATKPQKHKSKKKKKRKRKAAKK